MAYTATNKSFTSCVCAHAVLQSNSNNTIATQSSRPRVVVVGPRDCGKYALVLLLAEYSFKVNGIVIFVDAKPSRCGAPGVVAGRIALSIVKHLDLDFAGLVHDRILQQTVGHSCSCDRQAGTEAAFDAIAHTVDEAIVLLFQEECWMCR